MLSSYLDAPHERRLGRTQEDGGKFVAQKGFICDSGLLHRCGGPTAWEALRAIDAFVPSSSRLNGKGAGLHSRWHSIAMICAIDGKKPLPPPPFSVRTLRFLGTRARIGRGISLTATSPPSVTSTYFQSSFAMLTDVLLNRNSLTSAGTLPPRAALALPVTTCSSGRRRSWAL